jgi:2',3'-cyclic-nucleotide 2'-phosphodiesterase (5'-nucleotidase family)
MGGVARRAAALAVYRRSGKDTAVLVLETGNDMKQSDNLDDPANKWMAQALELLNINIVNTTIADLRRLTRLSELDQLPKEMHSLYLSSIVEPGPSPKFSVKPYSIQTLRPSEGNEEVHVGVLAVSPPGREELHGARLLSPEEAIERYLPEVDAKSDIVILLARMSGDQLVRLARMYPGIDIIINGSSTGEGQEYPKVGDTVIVEASKQGESLGTLEVEWDAEGHITKSVNQPIPLPPMITDSPQLAAIVDQAHAEQARLAEEEAKKSPPLTIPSVFAGDKECKICHEKAFQVWEKSKHAHAIDALIATHDQYNQACIPCHVTGLGVNRGYADLVRTAGLANVQCEACHGMSVKHVKSPQTEKPGLGLKVKQKSCTRCHAPEQSPNFNFETYWAKIKH